MKKREDCVMRMLDSVRPLSPVPEPLYGREPGTWQHDTVSTRLATIAQRVIDEGEWDAGQQRRLEALIADLPYAAIRPLDDPNAPDAAEWDDYVRPHVGQNWLNVPWFFAEMIFFRRVLEATGYFGPGPGEGVDPYRAQKVAGLAAADRALEAMLPIVRGEKSPNALRQALALDLWGNQVDLSIWPSEGEDGPARPQQAHLLIDELGAVADYLLSARSASPLRIDFLIDNAGVELAGDLLTADYLLRHNLAETVNFHVKPYPTFVSDATIPDVAEAIGRLADNDREEAAATGLRLRRALSDGRLALHTHPFWVSPLPFWEMPIGLRAALSASDLIIVKGDMNYRRLHGDRHWPFDTPFETIVHGAPAPLVALRVVKAEVASGLSEGQVTEVRAADAEWMTSGRWGMAPFYLPSYS